MILSRRKLPIRLLVLSALPDDRESFSRHYFSGKSDFLRMFDTGTENKSWDKYKPTAKVLTRTFEKVEKSGGTVIRDFRCTDLAKIVDYDVVVVIAHHSDNSNEIEIGGEMIRVQEIVDEVPVGSNVVMDMTSCYSSHLIPKLKGKIPNSRIIGIDVATSLSLRMFLLERVVKRILTAKISPDDFSARIDFLNYYIDALKEEIATFPQGLHIGEESHSVHLGGDKLQSSIYAPKEVCKGEDFIVSVFMHKQEESDEIEIIAKSIDNQLDKRSTKRIKLKIKTGDRIDFQIMVSKNATPFISFDKRCKGFIWDDEINDIEFIGSVKKECSISAFKGCIKIFVNRDSLDEELSFSTEIVEQATSKPAQCADFEVTRYDKVKKKILEKESIIKELLTKIESLKKSIENSPQPIDPELNKRLKMCTECVKLLNEEVHKTSREVFTVFVSSTSDLQDFRQVMREMIESCQMYPDMYENWGQGSDYPRDMCCKHILQSDIFVCLLGARYGFVEPDWEKSMTEIEYRIASIAGIPMLIYIVSNYEEEMAKLSGVDKDQSIQQKLLIEEVSKDRLVEFFPSEIDLKLKANSGLLKEKHKLLQKSELNIC